MDILADRFKNLSSKAKNVILNSTLTQIESGCCQLHSYQSIIEQGRKIGYALRLARFCFIGGKGYTGEELCSLYKRIIDKYGYTYLPLNISLGTTADVAEVVHVFTAPPDQSAGGYTGVVDFSIETVYGDSCANKLSEAVVKEAVGQFSSVGLNISNVSYASYIKCSTVTAPKFKNLLAISTGSDLFTESFKGSAPCILVI